ncbi:MAG: hypothetical protein Q4Q17_04260 [Tissierellia bacterium]|nr:hypothetical protein [Tissierellia bacterium]
MNKDSLITREEMEELKALKLEDIDAEEIQFSEYGHHAVYSLTLADL